MLYLIEFLLFLLPFAGYAVWRRLNPGVEPRSATLLLALAAVGLGLGGAVWYGLSSSFDANTAYVPARLGVDGAVLPGRAEPGGVGSRGGQGVGQVEVRPPERLR